MNAFTTYVYRGRNEREYPVEVEYRLIGDRTEVTSAVLIGDSWPLTSRELQIIDELADDDASLIEDERYQQVTGDAFGPRCHPFGAQPLRVFGQAGITIAEEDAARPAHFTLGAVA